MAKFDAKSFNEKAFGKYMSAIPNVKLNKLRESRAIVGDARLRNTFVNNSQTGTVYAVLPFFGLLSGTPQNYDGVDNVTPDRTDTFEQGVFTYGRMNGWTEADFSYDITGGTDFMANVRSQINDYWNSVDQDVILAILKGVFGMKDTGTGDIKKSNAAFVEAHTYDIAQAGAEHAQVHHRAHAVGVEEGGKVPVGQKEHQKSPGRRHHKLQKDDHLGLHPHRQNAGGDNLAGKQQGAA